MIDLNVDFREVPVGAWLSCLAQVGEALKHNLRLIDFAFRCDGTEFAVLLPQTAKDGGCQIACLLSKVFQSVEWLRYGGKTVKLPVCFGVASYPKDASTKGELVLLADEMMSLVRKTGRGGVAAANMGVLELENSGD